MAHLVRTGGFSEFYKLTKKLGGDPQSILKATGISYDAVKNDDLLISGSAFIDAIQMAAEQTQCEDFGIRLGLTLSIDILGPVGLLARQCETAFEAFNAIGQFIWMHNQGDVIDLEIFDDKALLRYNNLTPGNHRHPIMCEKAVVIGVSTMRLFKGETWNPTAVFFSHKAPSDTQLYRSTFRAPVYFGQDINAFQFNNADLYTKIEHSNTQLKEFYFRYVESLAEKNKLSFVDIVEHLVRSLLGSEHCDEQHIADILQINRRTLQRRLKLEKTTYSRLLAKIRADVAEQYLRSSKIPFTELANTLGYSELSAFTRFFKSHFGTSPTQYRQQLSS